MENNFNMTNSAAMRKVFDTARKIALSDLSVIIIGEHGTGKEWLARMMHKLNTKLTGPFWPFDCAAIAENNLEKELFGCEEISNNGLIINRGAFEEAENGTLLLNEISSLPLAVQMKVSRAIEFRTIRRVGSDRTININARTISTLSQPAGSLISDGLLSEDIFSRISPVVLEIPPLRYHKVDIPDLIEKFLSDLRKHNPRNILGMGKEALELCVLYDWPGNVRHLKNAVEYAFIMCAEQWIQPHHLPNYLHNEQSNFNLTYQAGSEKKQTNHLQKCK